MEAFALSREELVSQVTRLQKKVEEQRQQIIKLQAGFPSFIYFPRLPKELRLMIWKRSCIPRIIPLDWEFVEPTRDYAQEKELGLRFCPNASRFSTSYQIPISAVCKESRDVFEELYEKVYSFEFYRVETIYMNLDIDILFVPEIDPDDDFSEYSIDAKVFASMCGPRSLRRLAISEVSFLDLLDNVSLPSTKHRRHIYQILDMFPHLEELTVLDDEIPRDKTMDEEEEEDEFVPPYQFTDCKLVPFQRGSGNTCGWEILMGSILQWHDCVEKCHPAFAQIKVHLAGLKQTFLPGDYQSHYIIMGPAEETAHRLERIKRRRLLTNRKRLRHTGYSWGD